MLSVAFFLLELQKIIHTCTLDVLWGQPIKLIQVASNSELRENQWNDLLFFEIVPSHCSQEGTISSNSELEAT